MGAFLKKNEITCRGLKEQIGRRGGMTSHDAITLDGIDLFIYSNILSHTHGSKRSRGPDNARSQNTTRIHPVRENAGVGTKENASKEGES